MTMMFRIFLVTFALCTSFLGAEAYKQQLREKIAGKKPPAWALKQLEEDFQDIIPAMIATEALDATMAATQISDHLLVRYRIVNKQLYLVEQTLKASMHPRPPVFTKALHQLVETCNAERLPLPDVEFIVTCDDADRFGEYLEAPLLCFSKKRYAPKAILVPDADTLSLGGHVQEEVRVAAVRFPWSRKKNMAFWRGVTTGDWWHYDYCQAPRFILVDTSLKYPKWLDARFNGHIPETIDFYYSHPEYFGGFVPVADHLEYKYQILVDGYSTAWLRAYWQLFSNSVIIKIDSDEIQWYYNGLRPHVHYIPAAVDCSDLLDVLAWARNNDERAEEISKNAQRFAEKNLHRADMLYYIYLVLRRYAEIGKTR